MAIDLSALFGQQPDYSQFISPAEQQRMQQNAGQQALLNAAISALSMSGRTREPISTGQVLAGALGAGSEGYNQAFDRTLKQMVTGMQLEEYKRKQRARELASQAFKQEPVPIPMATGKGSQLEMLSRPEFGGDMAMPETVAALRANLPTRTVADPAMLARAAAMGGDYIEAAKLLEPKEKKLPSDIEKYQFAVSQGYKGSFVDFEKELRESGASKTEIKIPTEGERKAGVLANILDKNIAQLQAAVGKDPTAVKPNVASSVVKAITGSDYLSGSLTPAQRQIVEGAQLDILDAALTLRTGAAYTREQLEGYRLSYFPTLSDKPEQIQAKQQRLETLLDSAFMAAGRATPERITGKSGGSTIKPNYRFDKTTGTIVENN